MATNAAFPPFESEDGNNIVGIDVDIATQIAKAAGKELQIDDMEFDSIISAVSSGKADMGVAGMSITEERKKNVDFSDVYYRAAQVLIIKTDSTLTANAIDGKKIGVQSGTTGDTYVTDTYANATVNRYSNGVDAVLALETGKIDAVVLDDETSNAIAKTHPLVKVLPAELTVEEYAIAVKKGNTSLLKTINDTIAQMKSDGSMNQIFNKFGV
jgi:polar amino acid transport system substrate-binding protein